MNCEHCGSERVVVVMRQETYHTIDALYDSLHMIVLHEYDVKPMTDSFDNRFECEICGHVWECPYTVMVNR